MPQAPRTAFMPPLRPTKVFDSYWRFAAERQDMYLRRLRGEHGPWTIDPVLNHYRFTNAYRAADRVSQYLIADVQHGPLRSQAPDELVFRTILFKFFNRIETWQLIERAVGTVSWQSSSLGQINEVLDQAFAMGRKLYSAAYIMPAPHFGAVRKHANHLALLGRMMADQLPARVASSESLEAVYRLLLDYPGLGRFLAFQFAIDLNYSSIVAHGEDGFVVAGPGALDGISKCFETVGGRSAEDVIHWTCENQEREFERRGLDFPGLFGRRLMPIDCQNLFCEISKYARVAHPEIPGISGRTRIKQSYRARQIALPRPRFPKRWRLDVPDFPSFPDLFGIPPSGESSMVPA